MNIELTLKEAEIALSGMNALGGIKLPIKMSYRASKITRKLRPEVETFAESKRELFKQFGDYDKEKDVYTVPEGERREAFTPQLEGLEDETITLTGVAKLELDSMLEVDVEPGILELIDPFIDPGEE